MPADARLRDRDHSDRDDTDRDHPDRTHTAPRYEHLLDTRDPEAVLARLDDDVRRARERAEVASRVQAQVADVRGTGRSRSGDVVATADTAGRLLDLRLTPAALRLAPESLARAVLTATRQAEVDAASQTLDLVAAAFGADSGVVGRLQAELADRHATGRLR